MGTLDGRVAPLTPTTRAILTQLVTGKKPTDYVFTKKDGSPITDFRTI